MGSVETCRLALNEQEIRDLIEAALVCECANVHSMSSLRSQGLYNNAGKLEKMNIRLMPLVKKLQEAEGKLGKGSEKGEKGERAARGCT